MNWIPYGVELQITHIRPQLTVCDYCKTTTTGHKCENCGAPKPTGVGPIFSVHRDRIERDFIESNFKCSA